jgi:hypothetical protein
MFCLYLTHLVNIIFSRDIPLQVCPSAPVRCRRPALRRCYPGMRRFSSSSLAASTQSVQNEPQNADQTYPTCEMSVGAMGAIATHLRTLLNQGGLNSTKVIGYEHNWVSTIIILKNASHIPV